MHFILVCCIQSRVVIKIIIIFIFCKKNCATSIFSAFESYSNAIKVKDTYYIHPTQYSDTLLLEMHLFEEREYFIKNIFQIYMNHNLRVGYDIKNTLRNYDRLKIPPYPFVYYEA